MSIGSIKYMNTCVTISEQVCMVPTLSYRSICQSFQNVLLIFCE